MVIVKMDISKAMDEITRCEVTNLCNHHREQSIRSYVERNTQENIRTALVKLAGEFSFLF